MPILLSPKNNKTIYQLVCKLKDSTNNTLSSNFIYKINNSDRNGIYTGQTKRYIKDRIKEHQYCISKYIQPGSSVHNNNSLVVSNI